MGFVSNNGALAVAGLEGLLLLEVKATKQGRNKQRTSLQSFSNSETNVTDNLTSFEEL